MPVKKVFVRSAYNYDTRAASAACALVCPEPTRTQIHQAAEADINTIVRNFGVTGKLPVVPVPPSYGDFDLGVHDYRSALDLIRAADDSFKKLDAEVRKRFDHDPAKFLEFCSDPNNIAEMRKMGLALPSEDPLATTEVVAAK